MRVVANFAPSNFERQFRNPSAFPGYVNITAKSLMGGVPHTPWALCQFPFPYEVGPAKIVTKICLEVHEWMHQMLLHLMQCVTMCMLTEVYSTCPPYVSLKPLLRHLVPLTTCCMQHKPKQASRAQQLKNMCPVNRNKQSACAVYDVWFHHNFLTKLCPKLYELHCGSRIEICKNIFLH